MPCWPRAALCLMCLVHVGSWTPPSQPILLSPQLKVRQRRDLNSPDQQTHIVHIHGWLVELQENNAISAPFYDECQFYKGKVVREEDSTVALTECAGQLYGLLQVRGKDFILQPTEHPRHAHVLRRRNANVTLSDEPPAFNLTGDTVTDLELNFDEDDDESGLSRPSNVRTRHPHTDDVQYSHTNNILTISRPTSGPYLLLYQNLIIFNYK